jgi:dihydroflavonol-4-reductase
VGASKKGRPADEETIWDLGDLYVPYVTTKYIAEFEAYRAFAQGLPVVIVNPCAPMGARDLKPTPTGKLIVDFLNGKMPMYPPMLFNVVDVDDVARGHRLAMEKGRLGQRYILGSENVSLKQVLRTVARMTGVRGPLMAIPVLVGVVFSFFAEFIITGILRKPTLFTVDGAWFVKKGMHASNRKAVAELGWNPAPLETCLRKAIRWYVENGYIKKQIRLP